MRPIRKHKVRALSFKGVEMRLAIICGALCAASCSQPSQPVIPVAHNNLGVVELELDRTGEVDDSVFELRGLDANHDQVASVTLRIGTIADLPGLSPGVSGAFGSEIVLA